MTKKKRAVPYGKKYLLGPILLKILLFPILFILYRIKIIGAHNIPSSGGAVIMSNHLSHLDSFVVAAGAWRRTMFFMADSYMFKLPLFGPLMPKLNAYPIWKRQKQTDAIKYTVWLVKNRDALIGYYPEGHRSRSGTLTDNGRSPGKLGAGWVAQATNVPIIPCIIYGANIAMPTGKLFSAIRKVPLYIKFGAPIYMEDLRKVPPSKEVSQKATDRIMRTLFRLQKELLEEYNLKIHSSS